MAHISETVVVLFAFTPSRTAHRRDSQHKSYVFEHKSANIELFFFLFPSMVCVYILCAWIHVASRHTSNDCVVKIAKSTYFRFSFLHIWQTIFCEVFASRARAVICEELVRWGRMIMVRLARVSIYKDVRRCFLFIASNVLVFGIAKVTRGCSIKAYVLLLKIKHLRLKPFIMW